MGFGGRGAFGAAGCVWAGTAHGRTVSRGAGDACAAGGEVLKSDAIFFCLRFLRVHQWFRMLCHN